MPTKSGVNTEQFIHICKSIGLYAMLLVLSTLFAIPFVWALMTSLKTADKVYLFPPQWIPNPIAWENWVEVFRLIPLSLFFSNTIFITIFSLLGQLISASLVAYGFARFRFPWRNTLFIIMLSTIMLPRHITLIPQYILFKQLRWIDTFYPLIVPWFFGGGAFAIFLLRQFFLTLSRELDEAAKIDGAGYLTIFTQIILPLSKPALATLAVLGFLNHWNDFLEPLIYLNTLEKYTISIGLTFLQQTAALDASVPVTEHYLMVASLLATLPSIVLFAVAQEQFVEGIALTGVKG